MSVLLGPQAGTAFSTRDPLMGHRQMIGHTYRQDDLSDKRLAGIFEKVRMEADAS